jgi:hypothetical protein
VSRTIHCDHCMRAIEGARYLVESRGMAPSVFAELCSLECVRWFAARCTGRRQAIDAMGPAR